MSTSIVSLDGVTVTFDGFKAVDDVDFKVKSGDLHFLIGPNGAGKTTLLDVICGKVKRSSGRVVFKEKIDLTKKQEHEIVRLGIGRKFQTPSVFTDLTVFENIELALKQERCLLASLFIKLSTEQTGKVRSLVEKIGLGAKVSVKAGALSHGEKQWLEMGMLLAQDPELLLLDEPVAGMSKQETEQTGELLTDIAGDRTVLVVDHDMDFVRGFAQKVTVMHEGKIFREGLVDEVQADPRVVEIYLGKHRHAQG